MQTKTFKWIFSDFKIQILTKLMWKPVFNWLNSGTYLILDLNSYRFWFWGKYNVQRSKIASRHVFVWIFESKFEEVNDIFDYQFFHENEQALHTIKSRVLTRVTNYFFGFLGVHIYETCFKTRGASISVLANPIALVYLTCTSIPSEIKLTFLPPRRKYINA